LTPLPSSEPSVLDWDRIIHKGVTMKDGAPLGNIAAEDQDFIVILGSRSKQYRIPKSSVEDFDGSEVRSGSTWKSLIATTSYNSHI
jgi:hypothetical protein